MQNNIFAGIGIKSQFVKLIYMELMKRDFVSLTDILVLYYQKDKDYYKTFACSKEIGYGELKKAFSDVIRAIEHVCPNSIIDNGKKGKGSAKKYIGTDNDPLSEERKAVVQKTLEDYVTFCKNSASLLPTSWFSSFFENTQLLLETNKIEKEGEGTICSSMEQNLTNLEYLPILFNAITDKKVLKFDYHSFGHPSYTLIFHPQFLKEYNGRWFIFGEAEEHSYYPYVIAIDRICSQINYIDSIQYKSAQKGFYKNYFNNIIGVTHEKASQLETIIIRTKSVYLHGLMLTKPLHQSQIETKKFDKYDEESFGEIQLTVKPNRELKGKIMSYGSLLEVISPESFRNELKKEILQLLDQYNKP